MAFLTPEYGLRSRLAADATVQSNLNSSNTIAPLDSVPRDEPFNFLTYERTNAQTEHHMGGVSSSGLWQGVTEIVAWSETLDSAQGLADAVRASLDGQESFSATVGADSVTFTRCHLQSEEVDTFASGDGSDEYVYAITQTYEWAATP